MRIVPSLYVLGLGIWGALALPGSSADLERRQDTAVDAADSKTSCRCKIGYHSYYNPDLKSCSCVKDCDRAIKCAPNWHAVFDKYGCPTSCVPDCSQVQILCAPGYHVVEDASKCQTCVPDCPIPSCLPGYHEIINPDTGCINCEKDPDPTTCPTIRCGEGTHPFYNPATKQCSCNKNDGKTICLTATECSFGSSPSWNATTETCSCVKNVKRAAEPVCSNNIFCAAGAHKVLPAGSKKCVCQLDNPIPASCPKFKCVEKNHVVYHPETRPNGKCTCDPDCPGLFCISEQTPTYDFASNTCACQWIPGLEPTPVPKAKNPCADIVCIAEKRPVVNTVNNTCSCEWIPGLGPSPIKPREAEPAPIRLPYDPCREILCLQGMRSYHNTTSGECGCEKFPSNEIKRAPVICSTIKCISEKHGVWDPTSQTCKCVWIDGFGPVDS